MFSLSFGEMALIAVLALILIGPKQLPEIAKTVGRFLNDLKRTGNDIAGQFFDARDQVGREISKARESIQSSKNEMAKISQELRALPNPQSHQPHVPKEEVKNAVSDGWKKLQIKSEIAHSVAIKKKESLDGQ